MCRTRGRVTNSSCPEEIESDVDALFDELEREIGPFPVPLLDDEGVDGEGVTEFDLDEWPAADIDVLQQSLLEGEIPHRWAGRTLVVARDAEHVVDDLLDAIESGDAASLDEAAEAPDGALNSLYVAADRLARDGHDGPARGDACWRSFRTSRRRPRRSVSRGGRGR